MNIKILDCTLRDGGYINNWEFSDTIIKDTINYLSRANVEIIECGFLDENGKCNNYTRFNSINCLNSLKIENNTELVVMIEKGKYKLENLPLSKDTIIDGIRFSFRHSNYKEAIHDMKIIKKKRLQIICSANIY